MVEPDHDPKRAGPSPSDLGYEPETASGPVYQNSDVRSEPSPAYDKVIFSSGEEVGSYPEGSYQTWSPREKAEFDVEDAQAVGHFFSEQTPGAAAD